MKNTFTLSMVLMLSGSFLMSDDGTASWNENRTLRRQALPHINDENSPPAIKLHENKASGLSQKAIIGTLLLRQCELEEEKKEAEEGEAYARNLAKSLAGAVERYQARATSKIAKLQGELQSAASKNDELAKELQSTHSDKSKLESLLEEMRKAKLSMEMEIMELKHQLSAAPQAAAPQLRQDIEQSLQEFMQNFVTASVEDKKLQFEKCLGPLIESASQKAAEKTLIFLWAQLKDRMKMVKGDYTPEDIFEITMLNEMTQRMISIPGFDSLMQVQEKEQLSLEQEQDQPFYKAVVSDLDKHLSVEQLNIKECDAMNPKSTQHRAIPVLLYLLKVDSKALLSMATFDAPKWRQWPSFVRFLTLDQRRALRFHLKQGAFPGTFSTTPQKKEAILVFLETLQRSICENTPKRAMGQGDVANFNTQLLGHLKWMMENRGV